MRNTIIHGLGTQNVNEYMARLTLRSGDIDNNKTIIPCWKYCNYQVGAREHPYNVVITTCNLQITCFFFLPAFTSRSMVWF